jgi:ribosomal protein S13
MIYLLETKLPKNKSIALSLSSVYGIGYQTALSICKKLGFSFNLKTKDLTQEQTVEILKLIELLSLNLNNEFGDYKIL